MDVQNQGLAPAPPLRLLWRAEESISVARAVGASLYGITFGGQVTAYRSDSGEPRWQTAGAYLPGCLAADGSNLYAFQPGSGLYRITDQGATYSETLLYEETGISETTNVSQPIVLGSTIHFVLDNRLIAVDASTGGVRYEMALANESPFGLTLLDQDLLLVTGRGRPSRWRPEASGYRQIWVGSASPEGAREERPSIVAGDRVVVAEPDGVAAYSKATGARLWGRSGVGNLALAARDDVVYCAGNQTATWAVNLTDGSVRWDRKFLTFVTRTSRVGLAVGDDHLWVGALLDDGHEPSALWAVNRTDGNFAWQATAVSLVFGNGLPLVSDGVMYTYGSSDPLSAMTGLAAAPNVTLSNMTHTPNPMRGAMSGFQQAKIRLQLGVGAKVSFIAWHERDERHNAIGPITYGPGRHTITYDARWPRGWTDINQFGRLTFDIEETSTGVKYNQVILVPINTLPDIHHHWAKRNIEVMIYHQYIGGYPDLTFRPDNLVTRAESCTIIAKTLGLEQPSPSFRTRFTDISDHWAKNHIMALEEQGIIGGFLEPDGSYTFRPNQNMTRAQEARILVRAYAIPGAPESFESRFRDIAGHWAIEDIKALEAAGYVNGFREADGSYTYRPEQNLTRAELCTVVVRIRNLTS